MVLAPNRPDLHLALSRAALSSGKPVYIDKAIASTGAEALEIVRIANEHGTPLFSASSLRFAPELQALDKVAECSELQTVFARGHGDFSTYAIHTSALLLKYFPGVKRVRDTGSAGARLITLDNGHTCAFMEVRQSTNAAEAIPWEIAIKTGDKYTAAKIESSDQLYFELMKAILEFGNSRISPVGLAEQLQNVLVLGAADESLANDGEWVLL
jgi:hypothetical protein